MKRAALAALAAISVVAASCAEPPAAPSGLFVVLSSPDVYAASDFDTLQITAGSRVVTRSVTKGEVTGLPTSISIVGAPGTETKVEVRALLHGVVRLATYAKTTIPSERFAVLPLRFAAACRDRCVQTTADAPLSSYCDETSLECVHETIEGVDVRTLRTYDPSHDPTAGLESNDCGGGTASDRQVCNGTDTGSLSCTSVKGESSTGDLSCISCRGVESATCTNGNGLGAGAPWPTVGGSMLRQSRATVVGPATAPLQAQPLDKAPLGGALSSPVVAKDGTVWFTSSGLATLSLARDARAGIVAVVRNKTVSVVFQPDWVTDCRLDPKTEAAGSFACRWSTPIIADDDSVYAMTNTGVTFQFLSPDPNQVPFSTLDISIGCAGQGYCNFSQLGPIQRNDASAGRVAYIPAGPGFYMFKVGAGGKVSTFTNPNAFVADCPSWGDRPPAVGANGTFFIPVNPAFATKAKPGLCAVDHNGLLMWHSPITLGVSSTPAIGADGIVYFGGDDHFLHAIDPKAPDKFKWTAATGGATTAPAIGVDGTVYVGSADQYLYAFDPDGKQKWSLPIKGAISGAPLIDAIGTIYFGTGKGIVYAVSPNGTVLWKSVAGSAITEQGALAPDGTFYVGTTEGFVFAFPP